MKTKKFLSMAALALVGAMMTGCSNDDDILQPENKNNLVTLTTTVSLDGGATTRALTAGGVKTFAAGETMAIYYWKENSDHVKAVSAPLTAGDITNGGKSATFTFTLDNPYKDLSVNYVYPAAMANADFTPNYDALYNNQDGTLETLASNFDFCTGLGPWSGENLPSLTLENQLAILAINLKNGSSDINNTITSMVVSDGTNTYTVNRTAAEGPIYVAILPTTGATINVTATDGSKNYAKKLTNKTYTASKGYNVSWTVKQQYSITITGPYSGTKLVMEFCEGDTWNDMAAKYPTYLSINSTTKWVGFYTDGFIYDSNNKKVLATAQIDPNATYTIQ